MLIRMNWFDGLALGIVQGLTEFLPVSSTGHLIIAREWLGLHDSFGLAVDATLHLATALAVLIYFRKDIWELFLSFLKLMQRKEVVPQQKTLLFALIIGTIPGVILGLLLNDFVETSFRSITIVALSLIAGSILFGMAEWIGKQNQTLTTRKGFYLGLFQALALLPGMSRSGSVISGGLLFGLSREDAARFAFLLSFPIIIGAGGTKFLEIAHTGAGGDFGFPLLLASITAFLSGLAAIHFLITFLRKHTLYPFIIYRILLAAFLLLFFH